MDLPGAARPPLLMGKLAVHIHRDGDETTEVCSRRHMELYRDKLKVMDTEFSLDQDAVSLAVSPGLMFVVNIDPYAIYVHCESVEQWTSWTRCLRDTLLALHCRREESRGWQHEVYVFGFCTPSTFGFG